MLVAALLGCAVCALLLVALAILRGRRRAVALLLLRVTAVALLWPAVLLIALLAVALAVALAVVVVAGHLPVDADDRGNARLVEKGTYGEVVCVRAQGRESV